MSRTCRTEKSEKSYNTIKSVLAGGTFKFGGGNDMDVMRDSIHAQGQDIAHILDSF